MPVTPEAAPTMASGTISRKSQCRQLFAGTISADSAHIVDRVDRSPIITKAKSSSSAKSRERKGARVHTLFPSSSVEAVWEDRPRCMSQMSTARGRDGRRTESRTSTSFAPDLGPGCARRLRDAQQAQRAKQ